MIDTPRTDAIYPVELLDRGIKEHGRTWGWGVVSDFRDLARQLERELSLEKRHTEAVMRTLKDALGIEDGRDCLEEAGRLKDKVKQLRHALSYVFPRCDYLHHPKKCQHHITEPCPVEELIRKAQNP